MFFSYLERCWKCGTFLRQIATASLQKALKNIANQQGIPGVLLAVGTCALVLKCNMCHSRKKYNQSQLGKGKCALFQNIWWQSGFLSYVLALKMDNFFIKSETKGLQAKLKHNFHSKILDTILEALDIGLLV